MANRRLDSTDDSRASVAIPTLAMIVAAALGAAGCGTPDPAVSDERRPPSVILVVLDTLRADHLSVEGYGRDTSPAIDALAADGVRFSQALAPSNWTVPATASLVTSLYPAEHGAGLTGPVRNLNTTPVNRLPDRFDTVAELLQRAGFATALFSANPYLQAGIHQGSDRWMTEYVPADVLTTETIAWIAEHGDRPFYAHLQYMDLHLPINPPLEYAERYGAVDGTPPDARLQNWAFQTGEGLDTPDFEDYRRRKIALYDGALRFIDDQVARLVRSLDAMGLRDDTLIVVTSDHGEEFWEHAAEGRADGGDPRGIYGIGHGHAMYRELLDVPLIFSGPPVDTPRISDEPVSLLDVMPTILAAVGHPLPADLRGRDLTPLLTGSGAKVPALDAFVAESPAYGPDARALHLGPEKLVLRADGVIHLFDLASDPREMMNRADGSEPRIDELTSLLVERFPMPDSELDREAATFDEATEEQLRALGYIE
jgi:arylsulfatase A-like enzyme